MHTELSLRNALVARKRLTSVLQELGIAVRPGSFWVTNEDQLHYLYAEFCVRARERLWVLHPDHGGDGHAFGELKSAVDRVKRLFERRGIGGDAVFRRALQAQDRFEERVAGRIRGPRFRNEFTDEIDLSAWERGVYDRIVSFVSVPTQQAA